MQTESLSLPFAFVFYIISMTCYRTLKKTILWIKITCFWNFKWVKCYHKWVKQNFRANKSKNMFVIVFWVSKTVLGFLCHFCIVLSAWFKCRTSTWGSTLLRFLVCFAAGNRLWVSYSQSGDLSKNRLMKLAIYLFGGKCCWVGFIVSIKKLRKWM